MLKLIMGSALLLSLSMTAKAEDYIKAEEYKERRTTLSEKLGGNHIVILFASEQLQRSYDTTFHYQPDVSLRYIAGATQIESIMLMSKSGANLSTMLFNKSSDPLHEKWEGRIASNDAVSKKTGINRVMPVESFERFAGGILDRASADTTLYLDLNHYHKLAGKGDSAAHEFAAKVRKLYPHINIKSVTPAIKEMREVKSDAEIALMRKAVEISAKAHIAGIKRAKTATHEYQIEAAIEHVVRDLGAEGVGYGSIIGSAESSTILHYKTNQRPVEKNSIIMVDAAAEYRGYSADISRTFPANGKFSKEQREIYQIVYDAEEAAIVKTKPGATYTELSNAALEIIGKGLLDLGLITKNEPSQIRWYYYHGLGHGIGLNVHDPVSFGGLKAGNIFTIEPGVYVNKRFVELEPGFQALPEAEQASILKAIEKYNNIGVRIEDDILVTETGYENLSVAAPRKIDEIEKLMSQ